MALSNLFGSGKSKKKIENEEDLQSEELKKPKTGPTNCCPTDCSKSFSAKKSI